MGQQVVTLSRKSTLGRQDIVRGSIWDRFRVDHGSTTAAQAEDVFPVALGYIAMKHIRGRVSGTWFRSRGLQTVTYTLVEVRESFEKVVLINLCV